MTAAESKPLIPPQDLVTIAVGFVLGICIIALFLGLATTLQMPLLVEHWNIPRQ